MKNAIVKKTLLFSVGVGFVLLSGSASLPKPWLSEVQAGS